MTQAPVAFVLVAPLVAHPAVVLTPVVPPILVVPPIPVVHRAGAPRTVVPVNRLLVEADLHGVEVEVPVPVLVLVLILVRAQVLGPQAVELHPAVRVRIMVALHLAVQDLRMAERSRVVWASESKLRSITARNCIILNTDFLDIGTDLGPYVKGDIYLLLCRNIKDSESQILNAAFLAVPS